MRQYKGGIAAAAAVCVRVELEEEGLRVLLDELGEVLEEERHIGAVNMAMVGSHGDGHLLDHAHHSVLLDDRGGRAGGDRHDGALARRQDRDKARDAEHAEVRDREGARRVLVRRELLFLVECRKQWEREGSFPG